MCAPMDSSTSLKEFPQDFLSDESLLNIVPQLQLQLEYTHAGKDTKHKSDVHLASGLGTTTVTKLNRFEAVFI